jgi:phage protein D
MKPFYLIECDGVPDFNDYVASFSFKETIEGDNVLSFEIGNATVELVDSDIVKKGKEIVFSFGYKGGEQSRKRKALITDVDIDESETIRITVKALDKGHFFRKENSPKLWNGKASDFASEIASKYGLKTQIETSDIKYTNYPQTIDDYTFLAKLAKEQKGGDFHFWVDDDILNFRKIDLSQSSQITIDVQDGNVISFRVSEKTTTESGNSAGTSTSVLNKETGKIEEVKKTDSNLTNNVKTGEKRPFYNYNEDGKQK